MGWIAVEEGTATPVREQVAALLAGQECSCMDAASMLNGRQQELKLLLAHTDGATVDALLFFTTYDRVIPVLHPHFTFHNDDVQQVEALAGNAVYLPASVSGKAGPVDMFLERFSCGQRRQVVEHYIMELLPERFVKPNPPEQLKISVHRGTKRHLLPLLPLQKTYEKQEVLLNPESFDIKETIRWLSSILSEEICFYAKRGFRYVAKANTNATGFSHIQIGGVFTVPHFRGQGYARHTVAALCRHIIETEHRIPSLFVRRGNERALRLYRSLGFEIVEQTKTVYLY